MLDVQAYDPYTMLGPQHPFTLNETQYMYIQFNISPQCLPNLNPACSFCASVKAADQIDITDDCIVLAFHLVPICRVG